MLNLEGDPMGHRFIQANTGMFGVAKELFDLSLEEKMQFKTVAPEKLLGYKGVGFSKTEKGEPDRCEFFNVGHDALLGDNLSFTKGNPKVITDNRNKMISYLTEADPIVQVILKAIGAQLGLPGGKLSSLHRRERPSGSTFRMICFPPQTVNPGTSMVQHTDFGILTIVSNILGGLEVPDQDSPSEPSNSKWLYIKPEPNCVVINIGDALVEWTGGILRSSLHRVTFPPGQQASCTRYSIAYLIRPEKDTSMKRLIGGYIPPIKDGEEELDLTAGEWEKQRVIALRDKTEIMQSRGGKGLSTQISIY